jgi:3-hydroxyisobutyrate dehydrogenase
MKVGFIGTGTMGIGMALNLRKAGHELVVHDLRRASAEPVLAAGATWADTVAALGRACDVVFTSLPGPKEMEAIGVGEGGLLGSMRKGSAWFDLTTNSPTVVQALSRRFEEQGVACLDAPVSGGPAGARSGKLALYIGGNRQAFERHKALLDAIGDRVMYVGAVGAGNTAKIVHNLIALVMRMAIAEGISLGVKAGLDPVELWYAVRQGALGRSRTLDTVAEQYLESRYDPPSFALRLAFKDFNLAMDLAREYGVPMKQAQAAYEDYSAAMERGWSEIDSRSPMHLQNERAGVTIKASADDVQKMLARG